jgi:SNF2 family DNA or RNA helicase
VFPYNSARKWVRWYGVLEERTYGSRSDGDAYSAYNATKKRKIVKEKPGVSPAILRYLIDNTIFLTLKDLGVGLPSYQEEIVKIEMSDQQAEQYRRMFTTLKARAKEDRRYLSTFLQWSLGRPNSGFRDEEVIKEHRDDDGNIVKRERLCTLPAVVDTSDDDAELMDPSGSFREGVLLPKERWLVNYTNSEVDAGRKVIVYVRQTATRDIRGRLKDVLEATGLRARILDSSVGTREREAWVERYENSTDVLIVNPRLVETGLDLVQFCTVVFYEISYSLYTMWQAMRRVWRLGQRRPVKVVFAVYRETIERRAAGQMGDKMRGAQLLFGDEVGGALVPEEGDNFLTQLARNALEGKELRDLQAIFAEAHPKTTNSPMGSPTVKSPRMTMAKMRSLWLKQKYKGNDGRRKKRVHEAQQTLF